MLHESSLESNENCMVFPFYRSEQQKSLEWIGAIDDADDALMLVDLSFILMLKTLFMIVIIILHEKSVNGWKSWNQS